MLTITANIPGTLDRTTLFWSIGKKIERYAYAGGPVSGNDILSIDAYGAELEFIKKNMRNLQYPKNVDSVKWYGDTAKLIFQCLPR